MDNITFRTARKEDVEGILEIYAPYITNTSLTFEAEVPTPNAFIQRIENYLQQWPWLVCEVNDQIAGYAYANNYRERICYQWSVECSVYLHDNFKKKGIAKALYTGLTTMLSIQGYRNVYAVINLPNDASVRFHENFGFTWFATYENVGYKLGKWKNVGWWQLQLNEYTTEPEAPLAFQQLPLDKVTEILHKLEFQIKTN